jgi:nicotinamide mononucleotide transporter
VSLETGDMPISINLLQIPCTILGVVVVLLNAKEKVLAWPLTMVATVLGLFIYYEKGLYAKCALNIIYLTFGLYGWYQWLYGNKHKTSLQVSKTSPRTLGILLLSGLLSALVLRIMLVKHTYATLVCADSAHTAFCLIAQWMTARKKLESWILWGIADVLFTVVCYQKELYWFSGLHAFYFFLAVHGYRSWRQTYRLHTATVPISSEDEIPG